MVIGAFDIETYEEREDGRYYPVLNTRKFFYGGIKLDNGTEKYFTDHEEMYQWILNLIKTNKEKGERTFLYAHHSAYDWFGIAKDHLLDEDILYINFDKLLAIIDKNGYIIDTMYFYRMALADVGKILGYEKLEMPKSVTAPIELHAYLARDIDITLKSILLLKEEISNLGFKPRKLITAGQLAMTSFRTYLKRNKQHWLLEEPTQPWGTRIIPTQFDKEIREAYKGANTTAYQIGTFDKATSVDINGMYAYVMKHMDFPNLKTEIKKENPELEELEYRIKENIGVACVSIQAPNIALGYLGIRYQGYLMFPTNRLLTGTWTFLEIQRALKLGYTLKHCDWMVHWEKQKENPFAKFVDELYEMEKTKTTKKEKMALKLIRNNLYGKFGQKRRNKNFKIVHRAECNQYLNEGYTVIAHNHNKYIMEKENEPYVPSYINSIISCLITAGGRDYLYTQLQKIPYDDLLYCDTDSIVFKGNHLEKLDIGLNLGQFKLEETGTCKILGEKRYRINKTVHVSGIPKRNVRPENIDNEDTITHQEMIGLRHGMRTGNLEFVGTFRDKNTELLPHNKHMLYLPSEINEIGLTYEK